MKHLVVDISGHGFGHLGQTSAVLNALAAISEPFLATIRSTLSEQVVKDRIQQPFTYIKHELDKGMVMLDAVHTDAEESFVWYQEQHANYAARVEVESQNLQRLKPDLLLANVPYLSLEAAASLDIPSIALCSLNWFEILGSYCADKPEADQILKQILMAYGKAECFLRPEPSLAMDSLKNTQSISAISGTGTPQREVLLNALEGNSTLLDANGNEKFVLVSLGGISSGFSIENWPKLDGVYWIMPDNVFADRDDFLYQRMFNIAFLDILSSVDLIITKTGYGTLVESVSHQKPVICVERGDWPEEAVLFPWCHEHGYIELISYDDLQNGNFAEVVQSLLRQTWQRPQVSTEGATEAAIIVRDYLFN